MTAWRYDTNSPDYADIAVGEEVRGWIVKEAHGWVAYHGSQRLGMWVRKRDAAQAVADGAEGLHDIEVRKYRAGGHPIAGWNWPRWGFLIRCKCRWESGNVAGHTAEAARAHLEGSVE